MKLVSRYFLTLAAFCLTATAPAQDAPLTVALIEFDSAYKVLRHDVSDLLVANLSADSRVILVDRSDLKQVLKEQALGLSGNVSSATAAKVGQLTGAKVLVTGRVFKVANTWAISARITGTETGRVFSETVKGSRNDLFNVTSNLSQRIAGIITTQATNLTVDAALSREERIAKMVKHLKGPRRPAVTIKIQDHSGDANTTAENELSRTLQKAGFTLVSEKSRVRPDVLITGTAIVSNEARHGTLVSCRARLEIEAQERKGGKVLLVDRQVNVGVDLERETARILALENAADALAERLLPVLAKPVAN